MTLMHICASPGPVDTVLTWASLGPGYSLIYLVLTWISWLWFPYGAFLVLVPVVSNWPQLKHNDSDPYLGLSWTC